MGKTNQPLTIWVEQEWLEHPKVKELREKGHSIEDLLFHEPDAPRSDAIQPDLILSRAAHAWDDTMWDYLEMALKAARKRKAPAKGKKKK